MGRIFTSYFGNYRNFPEGCYRISIARKTPKDARVHKEKLEVAPEYNILYKYKEKKIDKDEYTKLYKEQLSQNREMLSEFVRFVLKKAENRDVILLCYEKSGDFCHRNILRKVVNRAFQRYGISEIMEL